MVVVDPATALLHSFNYALTIRPKPLTLSNNSQYDVYVSIGFSDERLRNNWQSMGWFRLDSGETQTYQVPALRIGGIIYVHARTKDGGYTWGSGSKIPVAVPTTSKIKRVDRFLVSDPKHSAATISDSTRASRIEMAAATELLMGPLGKTWSFSG